MECLGDGGRLRLPAGADGVSELLADVEILSEILDGRLFVHVELVELVVGEAFLTQVELVDKELPREALCVFLNHARGRLCYNGGAAPSAFLDVGVLGDNLHGRSSNERVGPERVDADLAERFGGEAEGEERHAKLGDRVCARCLRDLVREDAGIGRAGARPSGEGVEVERWGEGQDVRVVSFVGGGEQVRQGKARHEPAAARVDAVHQVIALDARLVCWGHIDRRGVVDDDIESAELVRHRVDRRLDRGGIADVELHWVRNCVRADRARRRRDLVTRRIDGSGQLGVRRGRLGRDYDVGAAGSERLADLKTNAARSTRDERRASGQAESRHCEAVSSVEFGTMEWGRQWTSGGKGLVRRLRKDGKWSRAEADIGQGFVVSHHPPLT